MTAPLESNPTFEDVYTAAFDSVSDNLNRLAVMASPLEKVKAMDEVVQAVLDHVRIKFELKLQDVLSRSVPLLLPLYSQVFC